MNAWEAALFGYLGTVVLGYGLQTFPVPQNKYGRWLLGVLNFAVANWQKGMQHFPGEPPAPPPADPPAAPKP